MKILLAVLVVGPLVLTEAAKAEVALSNPLRASSSAIHLIAAANGAEQETYLQQTKAGMAKWRSKIDDFTARTKVGAVSADQAASRKIQDAWSHVERASLALDGAGEDGWDKAKRAFEEASHDLEATWATVGPSKN